MMPNARPNAARERTRRFRWPFAKKRNRRVRPSTLTGVREPSAPQKKQTREPSGEQPAATPRASDGSRRPWFVGVLLLVVGGAAFGGHRFVTRSTHFAVRHLRFSAVQHVDPAALQARAGLALGTNLFAGDLAEIERKVLEEPWVKEAHARRDLPATVAVDVVERAAACVVALDALYLADARGVVFKRANPDEAA